MMDTEKDQASSEGPARPALQASDDREAPEGLFVVGIGASAGGLKALEAFFSHLPETEGMAFVVIVHLSPEHESQMAALLQQHTAMPVAQVTGTVPVKAGHVYVIPPGKDLSMTDGHLHLSERAPRGHAPIDLFFRTLAEAHGPHAVAVVLSGTGSDGAVGLGRIKEQGGLTMAQSPEEAEYDAMPRSAVATGYVDVVLPVAELAPALQAYRLRVDRGTPAERSGERSREEDAVLTKIFAYLRARTGHDFTYYKHSTILRRLTRRLHLTGTEDLKAYLGYLRNNPDEAPLLLKDLLLTVTNFFRDPDAFAALEKEVIPKLFEDKAPDEAVRTWVCGCATGEEAYSVAMLLGEEAERRSHPAAFQVFASDISDDALRVAREGLYPEVIASDVPAERLSRFFDQEPGGYRIKHEVREKIVFASHNLLQDPPFSRIDLITCRNVLIYLKRSVHGRLFELFHYALRPGGYLFLGNAESIDTPDLFRAVGNNHGLYQRRVGTAVIRPSLSVPAALPVDPAAKPDAARTRTPLDLEALHQQLITPYAPPSIIVSADHQVVHTLGGGEAYLAFTPGRPTQDVLKVVRDELRLELRTALYRAFRKAERTRSRAIEVRVEGTLRQVELVVEPITEPGFEGDHVHVLFCEVEPPDRQAAGNRDADPEGAEQEPPDAAGPSSLREANAVIRQLEDELDRVKEQLQATTEEHEAAIEEMTASNEEMQSINEELRSTAEELETSKEELQSVNEELRALNEELESKIDEVKGINSDLQNLMHATEIGTIFLDRRLCIKRYTPQMERLFDVNGADVGRPLAALSHQLGSDALPGDAERVLRDLTMIEREVRHAPNEQWFLVRLRPYHSVDGTIEGVVITFVDVTEKKKYDEQLEALVETLEELLTARAMQIKQLASELVLAEQTERQRIAQILHDELQQLLFAFQMRVHPLTESLSKEQADRLAQATALIDRAMDITRTLTVELSPPVLKGEDITAALDWLALRMKEMHGLKVKVEASGPVRLPVDVRTLVYQLVRELLFNVVKHAGIDRARVHLVREDDRLVVFVEDKGAGFDMTAEQERRPPKQGGFGLDSVRQRLHLFGGRLEVQAAPGQGTRATLVVPLEGHDLDAESAPPGDDDAKPRTDQ